MVLAAARAAPESGDFPEPLALCISRDSTRMQFDDVLCVHWREALAELSLS